MSHCAHVIKTPCLRSSEDFSPHPLHMFHQKGATFLRCGHETMGNMGTHGFIPRLSEVTSIVPSSSLTRSTRSCNIFDKRFYSKLCRHKVTQKVDASMGHRFDQSSRSHPYSVSFLVLGQICIVSLDVFTKIWAIDCKFSPIKYHFFSG